MSTILQKRMQASKLGERLGDYLVTVERKCADPNYDLDIKNNKIQLNTKIPLYSVVLIPITDAHLELRDADGDAYVEFNKCTKLRLPLVADSKISDYIKEPSEKAIREACQLLETKGKITLFGDHKMVLDLVEALNEKNMTKLQAFIEQLVRVVNAMESANVEMQNIYTNITKGTGEAFTTAFDINHFIDSSSGCKDFLEL